MRWQFQIPVSSINWIITFLNLTILLKWGGSTFFCLGRERLFEKKIRKIHKNERKRDFVLFCLGRERFFEKQNKKDTAPHQNDINISACDCNLFGSKSSDCDKDTGQCGCKSGNSGQQCDICDDWAIITNVGCQTCTGCSRILKDYMNELSEEIGKTIRLKESGGRVTEDIEQLIFMKNTAILLRVGNVVLFRSLVIVYVRYSLIGMYYYYEWFLHKHSPSLL